VVHLNRQGVKQVQWTWLSRGIHGTAMYRASSVSQIFCSLEILLAIKYFYLTLEWTIFCSFSYLILMLHMKGSDYSHISEDGTSGSVHSS